MKESQIEETILEYLSYLGGFSCKIPNAGFFDGAKMVKHRSKHVINGISDVFLWLNGVFYCFEVKRPSEYKYVMKHYEKIKNSPVDLLNKKQKHLNEQIWFIENIRKQGFVGEFVCSVEMVRDIIKKR